MSTLHFPTIKDGESLSLRNFHADEVNEAADCTICYDKLTAGEDVLETGTCHQIYHPDCLKTWSKGGGSLDQKISSMTLSFDLFTCPNCRSTLNSGAFTAHSSKDSNHALALVQLIDRGNIDDLQRALADHPYDHQEFPLTCSLPFRHAATKDSITATVMMDMLHKNDMSLIESDLSLGFKTTTLYEALLNGGHHASSYLLENGANPDGNGEGRPMNAAISNVAIPAMRLLFGQGGTFSAPQNDGTTPLTAYLRMQDIVRGTDLEQKYLNHERVIETCKNLGINFLQATYDSEGKRVLACNLSARASSFYMFKTVYNHTFHTIDSTGITPEVTRHILFDTILSDGMDNFNFVMKDIPSVVCNIRADTDMGDTSITFVVKSILDPDVPPKDKEKREYLKKLHRLLYDRRIAPGVNEACFQHTNTPLHIAAYMHSPTTPAEAVTRALLAAKATYTDANRLGYTARDVARRNEHGDVFRLIQNEDNKKAEERIATTRIIAGVASTAAMLAILGYSLLNPYSEPNDQEDYMPF